MLKNLTESRGLVLKDRGFNCCFLGALYHKGMLSKIDLEPIPEEIRDKIIKIYQEG